MLENILNFLMTLTNHIKTPRIIPVFLTTHSKVKPGILSTQSQTMVLGGIVSIA